jgi:hypothetical protein
MKFFYILLNCVLCFRTIWISLNGDDDNSGNYENLPKKTIFASTRSSEMAFDGHNLKLLPGTYELPRLNISFGFEFYIEGMVEANISNLQAVTPAFMLNGGHLVGTNVNFLCSVNLDKPIILVNSKYPNFISGMRFTQEKNKKNGSGIIIHCISGKLVLRDIIFDSIELSEKVYGKCIGILVVDGMSESFDVINTSFKEITVDGKGGCIYISSNSLFNLTIKNSSFHSIQNYLDNGGCMNIIPYSKLEMNLFYTCFFDSGAINNKGGAIYIDLTSSSYPYAPDDPLIKLQFRCCFFGGNNASIGNDAYFFYPGFFFFFFFFFLFIKVLPLFSF